MRLVADLHVHSRYSRATSREADLDGYHRWARVKGVDIVGTGDFTHPAWLAELSSRLIEKDGLFVLRDAPTGSPLEGASPAARNVRFALTTEISSIYKKHGSVRKVHSLIGVRSLDDARRLGVKLAAIGNIASDGRPILGLDPKDLLAIVLETAKDGFLIPAHIWTPWFSLFGSKSGFDRIEECFEELTPHIFALETGLSSDPAMNWRWSALDRYRMVSNSDAHSPGNLAREANLLDIEPSWQGLTAALQSGEGFRGTVEFYPEEGKYHYDGHRACGVCMDPEETARAGGKCPACGKPVTVGVLSRVLGLADRRAPAQPRAGEGYRSLIPLREVLAELAGTGSASRTVGALYSRLIGSFGSELDLLLEVPVEDINRSQGFLLAEAIRRMREGRTNPTPGYDGEFGVIHVFDDEELARLRGQDELFPSAVRAKKARREFTEARAPAVARRTAPPGSTGTLDRDQEAIVSSRAPRILVSAGPGSGKTRVLVRWIEEQRKRVSGGILALTFTNRAAAELSERLALTDARQGASAFTFHSFSWSVLRENTPGLLSVISPSDRTAMLQHVLPVPAPWSCAGSPSASRRCGKGCRTQTKTSSSSCTATGASWRRSGRPMCLPWSRESSTFCERTTSCCGLCGDGMVQSQSTSCRTSTGRNTTCSGSSPTAPNRCSASAIPTSPFTGFAARTGRSSSSLPGQRARKPSVCRRIIAPRRQSLPPPMR